MSHLSCGVSLLHNFEHGKSWNEWKLGRDGIKIRWNSHGRPWSATFLPEVAQEQGWDHLATIKELVRKAGHSFSHDILHELELSSYQSSKTQITHAEYLESKM